MGHCRLKSMLSELIPQRPAGRAGLAEWYSAIFDAQKSANVSMAELALAVGVSAANLYYWRRRIRDGEQSLVRVVVNDHVQSAAPYAPTATFEVRLSASRAIVVPSGFDNVELQRLVLTLETC